MNDRVPFTTELPLLATVDLLMVGGVRQVAVRPWGRRRVAPAACPRRNLCGGPSLWRDARCAGDAPITEIQQRVFPTGTIPKVAEHATAIGRHDLKRNRCVTSLYT